MSGRDDVTIANGSFADARLVDARAVSALEIADKPSLVFKVNKKVLSRHPAIHDVEVGGWRSPYDGSVPRVGGETPALVRSVDDREGCLLHDGPLFEPW